MSSLNSTQIGAHLVNESVVKGISPRWIINGKLTDRYDPNRAITVMVLAIDSRQERDLQIGRKWAHRVIGEGEMHVRDSILREMRAEPNVGQKVLLSLPQSFLLLLLLLLLL